MSYEGYRQVLCENGHYYEEDAYVTYWGDTEPWKCPTCNGKQAWENSVNVTNGSYDIAADGSETMVRIDGFVELEIDKPAQTCQCTSCGNEHMVCPATYKIPVKNK